MASGITFLKEDVDIYDSTVPLEVDDLYSMQEEIWEMMWKNEGGGWEREGVKRMERGGEWRKGWVERGRVDSRDEWLHEKRETH